MKQKIKTTFFVTVIILIFLTSCTKNEVTSITLNNTNADFTIGQTDSLIATVTANGDINKFQVTWTTSNKSVVTVTNGKIEGVGKGTATITAKAGNLTATCEVTVGNEIYPTFKRGNLIYCDSISSTANMFIIQLAGPTDTLFIYADAPRSAITSLSAGTYQILTQFTKEEDFVPFTLIPGYTYIGEPNCSWYFGVSRNPITDGNLTVTYSNAKYTIEYNFTDGFGNTIYGTYLGSLSYYTYAEVMSAPASTKDKLKLRNDKFITTNSHFKTN
jgi:hypothetical protein